MRFPLGRTMITSGALATLGKHDIAEGLRRHASGDWGEVCDVDKASNDWALAEGTRLISAYRTTANVKYWIITEWDRSATTILLPNEY